MTPTIRAEIIGSDRCKAEGITVRASAPVLEMCRALIAAGYGPNRPLNAYRGKVLALRVCPIGDGAKYTIEDGSNGPRLRIYKGGRSRVWDAPMSPIEPAATSATST
jgi:hypothetical protein